MKNLATYLDDFIEEEKDGNYFEKCKTKKNTEKRNLKKEFLSEGNYNQSEKKKNKYKYKKY